MKLVFISNTSENLDKSVTALLISLLGKKALIGYIPSSNDPQRKYFNRAEDWFKNINPKYDLEYIDIHSSKRWRENEFDKYGLLYLSGGNTYQLLNGLKESNVGDIIRKISKTADKPILGVSAGAIVLTPDVRSAFSENELKVSDFSGFNLVDFCFIPHFPDSGELDNYSKGFLRLNIVDKVFAVTNNSGLFVTDNKIKPLGRVYKIICSNMQVKEYNQ